MSIQNARPTIWSAKILRALNTALVFGSDGVINRDYEGELSEGGDTVKILTVGDVKINSYTKDTDMAAAEALVDAALTLTIDQQDSFNFAIDNIDRRQEGNTNLMEEATRRAAYGLAKKADEYIAGLYTQADAKNEIAAVKNSTSEAVYSSIVEAGVKLDEADTPDDGSRFIVLPPASVANIQKDIRFVGYGTQPNRETLAQGYKGPAGSPNGLIGEIAGFKVYQSNNVKKVSSKWRCVAGHPIAWSFVQNLTKTVAYEPPLRFSDAVKGLHVYGAKVVRPTNLSIVLTE